MGGEDDVVFKTPLGNYKKWSEIVTALRDSLASSSSSKETRAASDPGGASSEKWSFVSSGSAGSGSSNHTLLTYDVIVNDDHDSTNSTIDTHHRRSHRPDIYLILVIGTVALLVLAILCFALYKAVQRLILKIPQTSGSAADSSSNTVEAAAATATAASDTGGRSEAANQPGATNQSNPATTHPSTSSSGTLTRLANGFRSFQAANLRLTATLRSTASSKSDGDNPPPYEDDLPPSYEAALKMGGSSHVMTSCRSSSSSLGSAAGAAAAAESTSSVELQAPPTDETDGKKHKRTSKFNFSVV